MTPELWEQSGWRGWAYLANMQKCFWPRSDRFTSPPTHTKPVGPLIIVCDESGPCLNRIMLRANTAPSFFNTACGLCARRFLSTHYWDFLAASMLFFFSPLALFEAGAWGGGGGAVRDCRVGGGGGQKKPCGSGYPPGFSHKKWSETESWEHVYLAAGLLAFPV